MRYALLIAVLLFAGIAAAHTVTMNLAMNVGGNNNTIRVNDTTYSGNTANSSVVLLTHLDNSTLDSSQYGNDGTSSGADCSASMTGRINTACSFDGINQNITISDSGSLDIKSDITIGAWIKHNDATANYAETIVSKRVLNTDESNYQLYLRTSNGNVRYYNGVAEYEFNYAPPSGQWVYLTLTINSTNSSNLYVNGDLTDTLTAGLGVINNGNLWIGIFDHLTTDEPFNGTIDEVIIYNHSLSAEEVYNLYNYGMSEPTDLIFTDLSKKYISSSQRNTTAALVSAGTLLNARFNNTYNSTHYLFQMTQSGDDNRFLFATTNGSYTDVQNKLSMVDAFRMVSSTFGNFITMTPAISPFFIRLEYTGINIDSRTYWSGTGELRIRNNGLTSRGMPNLTLEVVR